MFFMEIESGWLMIDDEHYPSLWLKLNTFKTSAVLFPLHFKPADSQYDGFDLFCHYIFDTDTKRARYLFSSLFSNQ